MPLTYRDVMATDLSTLHAASEVWKEMGDKFGTLRTNYDTHVRSRLSNGNWAGQGYIASVKSATITVHELYAAKKEAHAVAELLEAAYRELDRLKEALKELVKQAQKEGYKVDPETGHVTTDYESKKFQDISSEELRAYKQDPASINGAEQEWTQVLRDQVKEIDKADVDYRGVLEKVTKDVDGKGVKSGFNANADEVTKAVSEAQRASETSTDTNGWDASGKATASGPDMGFTATGPGYGKEFMVKAHADLGHATAEGSVSRGQMKLSGIADAYAGLRGTTSGGITDEGIAGNIELSGGVRALAEGRLSSDYAGVYGRGTGFAGVEGGLDGGLGPDGFKAGGGWFAGGKASAAGGVEAGGIGIGSTVEGWVGPGVEGDLIFGQDRGDGKFHIGWEGGASALIGGKVGMEVVIDPGKVADTAGDAAGAVGDVAGGFKDAAGSAKDAVTGIF